MADQPLHEISPEAAGDEAAALGFALGLGAIWAGAAGVVLAGEQAIFGEIGGPYPPGFAEFGLDPGRLVVVRGAKREEALWATEQALAAPGVVAICALGPGGRGLELKASRRLLLFAERSGARCLLLKREEGASAAWTRWRVRAAPSAAAGRELGPPRFSLNLTRNRAGPANRSFVLQWNADERTFTDMAGASAAAFVDGSADPRRARA